MGAAPVFVSCTQPRAKAARFATPKRRPATNHPFPDSQARIGLVPACGTVFSKAGLPPTGDVPHRPARNSGDLCELFFHVERARPTGAAGRAGAARRGLYPQLDPQPTTQAASADTPVPLALYRSAFAGVPTGVEQTRVDWKKANTDVGQFKRGHADLLKWKQEQAKAAQPASGSTPAPTR